MSHILLWLNRILFLKLIEANLLAFNEFDKALNFLISTKIKSFKALSHLFFEVLAKDYENRTNDRGFNFLPYLNSSLFIKDEKLEILDIALLDDTLEIEVFQSTQSTHKVGSKCAFLVYLFDFLNAFDFGKKSIQEDSAQEQDSKELIQSSVLGAVFEKLNGYKEGSFYTPSFITSYMCRESLSKIVVEKFNTAFEWNAQDLGDLRKLIDRDFAKVESKAKQILSGIRICDPAVGSGHFLVSALNEIIAIYHRLGLLGFGYKDLQINNDEIHLITKEGATFAYKRLDDSNHAIQKSLFELKKSIIENNLFGVDINPNSCNIARLRLWIELLKNAYYLNFTKDKDSKIHKIQTLPNIDINIKCGNSLISHFDIYEYDKDKAPQRGTFAWLKKKDSTFSNNFKEKLLRYNTLVQMYKEKLGDKAQIDAEISALKAYFKDTLLNNGFIMESLEKHLGTFVRTYGDSIFDIETLFGMEMIKIVRRKNFKFQPTLEELEPKSIDKKGQDLLAIIHKEFETLESLRKSDTFEWRFAFPEVLDLETFEEKQKRVSANNAVKATQSQRNMKEKPQEIKDTFGDFKGFDLVIGNPPYIRQQAITALKPYLKNYKCFDGAADIYVYFFELAFKLLAQNARFTFVTSNKWVKAGYGKPLQKFLLEKSFIESYIDFSGVKVFDSASVDVSIIEVANYQYKQEIKCCEISQEQMNTFNNDVETIISNDYFLKPQSSLNLDYFRFEIQDNATHLVFKLKSFPLRFSNIAQIAKGSSTGNDKAFLFDFIANDKNTIEVKNEFGRFHIEKEILVPFCYGEDIKRFEYCKVTKYLLYPYDKENILIHKNTLQNNYPLAYKYLENLKSVLLQRKIVIDEQNYYKFSALRNAHTYRTAKIMIPDLLNYPRFGFDNVEMFHNASIHNVALKENYQQMEKLILGVLNSKLFWFFIEKSSTKLGGSAIRLMPIYIDCFSFPKITQTNQKIADKIIALVDKILESKAQDSTFDTSKLESRIDSLVYELYNLNQNEIKIIEK